MPINTCSLSTIASQATQLQRRFWADFDGYRRTVVDKRTGRGCAWQQCDTTCRMFTTVESGGVCAWRQCCVRLYAVTLASVALKYADHQGPLTTTTTSNYLNTMKQNATDYNMRVNPYDVRKLYLILDMDPNHPENMTSYASIYLYLHDYATLWTHGVLRNNMWSKQHVCSHRLVTVCSVPPSCVPLSAPPAVTPTATWVAVPETQSVPENSRTCARHADNPSRVTAIS